MKQRKISLREIEKNDKNWKQDWNGMRGNVFWKKKRMSECKAKNRERVGEKREKKKIK